MSGLACIECGTIDDCNHGRDVPISECSHCDAPPDDDMVPTGKFEEFAHRTCAERLRNALMFQRGAMMNGGAS